MDVEAIKEENVDFHEFMKDASFLHDRLKVKHQLLERELRSVKEDLANLRRTIRANDLILFGVPDDENTNNLNVSVITLK